MTDNRRDRVAGALLWLHAGDSLGASVEFAPWEAAREAFPDDVPPIRGGGPFRWPAGHATDDTDLTRAVLLAYLDRRRDPAVDVVRAAADHMLEWLDGEWPGRAPGSRPVDVGGATERGLGRYRASRDPRRAGAGPGSAGNGSLMRCLPSALAERDAAARRVQAAAISAVTHDDARCVVACVAYVEIVAALLDGAEPHAAVAAGEAALAAATRELQGGGLPGPAAVGRSVAADAADVGLAVAAGRVLSLGTLVAAGPPHPSLPDDGGGFVLDSLVLAVAALLDSRPPVDVLVDVVRWGADADTNGAIAGGLLGARHGARALPVAWRSVLQFGDEFEAYSQL